MVKVPLLSSFFKINTKFQWFALGQAVGKYACKHIHVQGVF